MIPSPDVAHNSLVIASFSVFLCFCFKNHSDCLSLNDRSKHLSRKFKINLPMRLVHQINLPERTGHCSNNLYLYRVHQR